MLGRVMALKHGIAIAGTHGKSTTTRDDGILLLAAEKDPSFVVGATSLVGRISAVGRARRALYR